MSDNKPRKRAVSPTKNTYNKGIIKLNITNKEWKVFTIEMQHMKCLAYSDELLTPVYQFRIFSKRIVGQWEDSMSYIIG